MKKYQVIFHSGNFKSVDYETDDYNQAIEVKSELQAEMYRNGERDFFYEIKEIDDTPCDIDEDILTDDDFNTICGR